MNRTPDHQIYPKINASAEELMRDIKITDDPIKKTLLKKFLDLKIAEMRMESEDPSLDGLSVDMDSDLSDNISVDKSINSEDMNENEDNIHSEQEQTSRVSGYKKSDIINKKKTEKSHKSIKRFKDMMKKQESSLSELDNITRVKAYAALIEDNRIDTDKRELEKTRGKLEKVWEGHKTYDPRYIKYQKEDIMNNRLMERLNSEIDFRIDGDNKRIIEKPFDVNEPDDTDVYARYEQEEDTEDPRSRYTVMNRKRVGNRQDIGPTNRSIPRGQKKSILSRPRQTTPKSSRSDRY